MGEETSAEKNIEIKLDRKSKILFVAVVILIAGSVATAYWRYMVKKDYIIEAQSDCDPETENCFIWRCDPESIEEGEKCTGVPDNDIWYYKIIRRNAKNIPLCDPNSDENCEALTCPESEAGCEEILCNAAEGEECNDPAQYILENPPEEECEEGDEECEAAAESEECAPDDQECLNAQSEGDEECAPDDPACQNSNQEKAEENVDKNDPNSDVQGDKIPAGVEPM